MSQFDVIIVGYGPTGKVLARLLSDRGHKVAIVERWPHAYPLPRAVTYYHDIARLFHALNLAGDVGQISRPGHHYVWYNADWKILIDFDLTAESISGGPASFLFNQPELEAVLDRDLRARGRVGLLLGCEAIEVHDQGDLASIVVAPFNPATRSADRDAAETLTCRYLVGCDGANSAVRDAIGSRLFDHGFDAEWLVVDVRPHDIASLPIPDAAQWCNPARPTTIVPSGVANRRFEFMLLPGESADEIATEAKVWELLSPWMKPADGTLVRHAVYRFRSRLAQGWRKNRLLIAGDAAHVMPPFMGQGMCSGLRDAATLAWRLDFVLRGLAPDSTLDDYERERATHVDALIRLSMEMGKVVCVPDPVAARERDEAFFAGKKPPPVESPALGPGLVRKRADGAPDACAGVLLPHVRIERDGGTRRLDDVVQGNFALLTEAAALARLDPCLRRQLEQTGVVLVPFGAGQYRDADGRLRDFLAANGAVAVIARPDFYSFGVARSGDDLGALVNELLIGLGRVGTARSAGSAAQRSMS